MRIEGCPADIRLLQYILHGDEIVILAADEGDKRVIERRAGSGDSSIHSHSGTLSALFRTTAAGESGSGFPLPRCSQILEHDVR
jgi:hypothetical protein